MTHDRERKGRSNKLDHRLREAATRNSDGGGGDIDNDCVGLIEGWEITFDAAFFLPL